jgi:hypothetical protein
MALSDLTATVRAFVQWAAAKDITGLSDQTQEQDVTADNVFTFGSSTDNVNQIYAGVRTLNANTAEDLDMAGGLTNPLGETITFLTIKFAFVWLLGTDDTAPGDDAVTGTAASSITLGGDAASPALWFGGISNTLTVKNGGFFLHSTPGTGWTITGSTGDVLQVMNNDLTLQAKYLLVLGGTA